MLQTPLAEVRGALACGMLVPYLGAGMLMLLADCPVPHSQEQLAAFITAQVTVPHKIRNRLTAAAQFIENFKHRKTLVKLMNQAFAATAAPSSLHRALAGQPRLPLVVDLWYDDAMQQALAQRADWCQLQGLSQAEHFGTWYRGYDAQGNAIDEAAADQCGTLLYKPLGGRAPSSNYLISDSDYVELLTEIDIQTPIPALVQTLRKERGFLFLGCRFNDQLQRTMARQIMKRSAGPHWAVLTGELTRNERRFMDEQQIRQLDMPLAQFEITVAAPALKAA
jgi:SIR2-like domain